MFWGWALFYNVADASLILRNDKSSVEDDQQIEYFLNFLTLFPTPFLTSFPSEPPSHFYLSPLPSNFS